MLDVIEAIEGPMDPETTVSEGLSNQFRDQLQSKLRQVTAEAREQLRAIKLSQLIKPPMTRP